MGKRSSSDYIGGIVAIILAIFLLYAFLNPPSKNHYNPSKYLEAQHKCEWTGLPVFEAPSGDKTKSKSQKQPEKEKWCADRSDLAAQWKTADLTNVAFLAGILGIWLVGWTLFATRQASEISKDTAQRQLRAYIDKVEVDVTKPATSTIWNLDVKFQNVGQTPASDIFVTSTWFRLSREKYNLKKGYKDKWALNTIIEAEKRVVIDKIAVPNGGPFDSEIPIPLVFVETGMNSRIGLRKNITTHCICLIKIYFTDIYDVRRVRRIGLYQDRGHSFKEYENSEYKCK